LRFFLSPRKETERNIPWRVDDKTPISREKMGVSLFYDDARDTDKKPNKYCSVSLFVKTILTKNYLIKQNEK